MNPKHKIDAKILAHNDAIKKRNLRLKYIALHGHRKNRSEPALTKTKLYKTNCEKIRKRPVNHHVIKKNPTVLKKYPDVIKQPHNVMQKDVDLNVKKIKYPIIKMKTNDIKPAIKIQQKTQPLKQGFSEKIASIWHSAKKFLGLSNSNRNETQSCSIENKKIKHNLPVNITSTNSKRAIYVAKKPLIHHADKDSKVFKNLLVNERYHKFENKIEKRKIIFNRNKTLLVSPVIKENNYNTINCMNNNLQHEIKYKVNVKANEIEQIEAEKQILKDKPKNDIIVEINTNRSLCQIFTTANCHKPTLNDTNATVIIEIKNVSNNTPIDTKMQQSQNVNCAIKTLDVHKNVENCENTYLKKPLTKDVEVQHNFYKKEQSLVKELKKPRKQHMKKTHENTKGRAIHKRHKSVKRHRHNKQNCTNNKIKHIKQRECSTCGGYISTDRTQERKAHCCHKDKYDYKERCPVCKKRVSCLYHHIKGNNNTDKKHHDENAMRRKYRKETKPSKKYSIPTKNRSFHKCQKKKRTLTVCTNSRRNSFKNKKFKRTQMKPSTSKILRKFKYSDTNNNIPYTHINFYRRNSLIGSDSDSNSDSERQEATKVLSWWYLHYALNSVRPNEIQTQSNETDENGPFLIPYGDFCNVYHRVAKTDTNSDENLYENFEVTNNFPKHANSFTEEGTMISDNLYPNSSCYSSIRNCDELSIYDDTNTSVDSSVVNLEILNNTPQKSTIDLQTIYDE